LQRAPRPLGPSKILEIPPVSAIGVLTIGEGRVDRGLSLWDFRTMPHWPQRTNDWLKITKPGRKITKPGPGAKATKKRNRTSPATSRARRPTQRNRSDCSPCPGASQGMNGNPPKPQVALRSTLREGLPYHESSSLSYRPVDARRDRGVRSMGAWLVRVRAVLVYRQSGSMRRKLSA